MRTAAVLYDKVSTHDLHLGQRPASNYDSANYQGQVSLTRHALVLCLLTAKPLALAPGCANLLSSTKNVSSASSFTCYQSAEDDQEPSNSASTRSNIAADRHKH